MTDEEYTLASEKEAEDAAESREGINDLTQEDVDKLETVDEDV